MKSKLLLLLALAAGLGAVELWTLNELQGESGFGGPVLGAALLGALACMLHLLQRTSGHWSEAAVAAWVAVIELLFCLAAASSISALLVLLLPASLTPRLEERLLGYVALLLFGLGLAIAARGWSKYARQSQDAAVAQVEVERARAQVAERDRQLARTELTVLRAQIEPHFLWNTLAHIQYLTQRAPADADAMTGHLIRLLRVTVPQTRGDLATLGKEMDAVRAFLELMKIRMGGRLAADVELEPALTEVEFPPFVVQSLVENAIKHGIEPKLGPGRVAVSAALHAGRTIVVEVVDDGVGLGGAPGTRGTGLGLRNVRERLMLLYGGLAALRVEGGTDGGVVARVEVPLPAAGKQRT